MIAQLRAEARKAHVVITRFRVTLSLVLFMLAMAPAEINRHTHAQSNETAIAWVDYEARTKAPSESVAPMTVVSETLTVRTTSPTGDLNMWWLLSSTTRGDLDEISQNAQLIEAQKKGWKMAAMHNGELICRLQAFSSFLECIRAIIPSAQSTSELTTDLQAVQTFIMNAREPDVNGFDGADFVVLRGSFDSADNIRTDLRTCYEVPDRIGKELPGDAAWCQTYWLRSIRRTALITMCELGRRCDPRRLDVLTGSHHQVSRGGKWSLSKAIYYLKQAQQTWVTAHLLSEWVVPETLPKACHLQGNAVTCLVAPGEYQFNFDISFMARIRPDDFGVMKGDSHVSTVVWEVRHGSLAAHCPSAHTGFVGGAASLDGGLLHQIYLPFGRRLCTTPGCSPIDKEPIECAPPVPLNH